MGWVVVPALRESRAKLLPST